MVNEGFVLSDSWNGQLAEDGGDVVPLVVLPGVEYAVMGVCDSDCSDLDLEIEDGFGNLLDADYELDDLPGVYATALSAGSFNIFVDMIECSTGICYYGLAVFTRSF